MPQLVKPEPNNGWLVDDFNEFMGEIIKDHIDERSSEAGRA